jgi:hypothetical protein
MEAELLDRLVDRYSECRFSVVRHDPAADTARVKENYGPNFQMVESHEIDAAASPMSSILLLPVFDAGSEAYVTTYPNALRILGPDTSAKFAEIVAVDLLGSRFHYRPSDLVRISVREFTQIIHVPVIGRYSIRNQDVAA